MIETVKHPNLPKAPLIKFRIGWWWFTRKGILPKGWNKKPGRVWYLTSRMSNAQIVYLGPLEIVWRLAWLKHPAMTYYPELFTEQNRAV